MLSTARPRLYRRLTIDEYDAAQERGEVKAKPGPNTSGPEAIPTAADLGLTHKEIQEARQIRDAEENDPGVVRRTLDEKLDKREERRDENRALIAATPAIRPAQAKYATIVIDPPWDWGDEGDQDQLGRARPTYGTMSLDDLLALPVESMADVDCHIYLWITNRSLPKGFSLIERWGFHYITLLTWPKPSFGMGNYFRGQTEHLLVRRFVRLLKVSMV